MESVYHKGEEAVQALAGEQQMARMLSRGIRDAILGGAMHFINQQPIVVAGTKDKRGKVWASLLVGDIGFVKAINSKTLVLDEVMIRSTKTDVFYQNILNDPELGLLFIEHGLRMRFRVNGSAKRKGAKIELQVSEAYGNCPKYIQRNLLSLSPRSISSESAIISGTSLGTEEEAWIRNAHTFYVASRSLEGKTDASHRGGNQGFIELLDNGVLRIPDYPGNGMFNTLGNIYQNPQVGLLFIDYEKGETLQLSGKGEIQFDQKSEADLQKTGETGRFWLFKTEEWIRTRNHHQINWEFIDFSPFNP